MLRYSSFYEDIESKTAGEEGGGDRTLDWRLVAQSLVRCVLAWVCECEWK